jgi:dethiobiotin synthetase
MHTKIFSIVGTDTEIGKTYTTVEILKYLNTHGTTASGLKPISAGIGYGKNGLINEDVEQLLIASNTKLPYTAISPFALKLPIAPHIGAKIENIDLNITAVNAKTQESIQKLSQTEKCILVESVGGIMVPLNPNETYVDLLKVWQHPVIFVIGMKLGCLSHALLTASVLKQKNINVVGWIANYIDKDMPYREENINFLTNYLAYPLLGSIAHGATIAITPEFTKVFACN